MSLGINRDKYEDGYYWCRCSSDGTTFIALREDGLWYCCGVEESIDIPDFEVIGPVRSVDH
ncbi:MAG TPA: hypothetical protein VKT73_15445 [Xanthobacteraceae bacterium]|nr:hypothetical protein [Xanthobacteraceae bacterium]